MASQSPAVRPDRASTSANTNQDEFEDLRRGIGKKFPNMNDTSITLLANAYVEHIDMVFGDKLEAVPRDQIALIFETKLIKAAEDGHFKDVSEMIKSFPPSFFTDVVKVKLCEATKNRRKEFGNFFQERDVVNGDTILHLFARLVPEDSDGYGAVRRFQRDAQFFQDMQSLVQSDLRDMRNKDDKTADQLFMKTRKSNMEAAKKWFQETSKSLKLVAIFIATVAIAAAVTVPGGTSVNGIPNLRSATAFTVFVAADAVALLSSCVSMFMFLYILTAEYTREDLRRGLAMKFIIGHLMLFISVSSMTVLFTSEVCLIFGKDASWILAPLILASCLIISVYGITQVSLR